MPCDCADELKRLQGAIARLTERLERVERDVSHTVVDLGLLERDVKTLSDRVKQDGS